METDEDLITEALLRTGYMAAIFAMAGWWYLGWEVGAGVAVGAALAILNTMALRFVLDRLIQAPESAEESEDDESESASAIWATGLFFKMTLLLGAAYIAMAVLGVDPMALVFGYSLLLPGVMLAWWQYLARKDNSEN
jgi:hypothetical protein